MADGGSGHWLVRMEWCPAGWLVCLPLLIFPCAVKSRSFLLAPAHPGGPGKRAVKRLWCGCGGENYIKIRWFLTKLQRKISSLFYGPWCSIDQDEPGFERLSSTSSSTISASTLRGSMRRNVPSGVNLWRRLCPVKDAPLDDDDVVWVRPG